MKSKVGTFCIVLGVLLLLGALVLALFNMHQDAAAGNAAAAVLPQLVDQIQENTENESTIPEEEGFPDLELQVPV